MFKYLKYIFLIILDIFIVINICFVIFKDKQNEGVSVPVFSQETNLQPSHSIDLLNDSFEPNFVTINNTDFEMSTEIRESIDSLINNYNNKFAFYVVSLDETMSFGYNPDEVFHAANTVKSPFVLYCYKQIAAGEKSLYDTKIYENTFYHDGFGILQNEPFDEAYSIKDLLAYAIHHNDDIAYYMLLDYFGKDGYNAMLDGLGCEHLHLLNGRNWSETSPRDALTILKEIYKFNNQSLEGKMYLEELLNAEQNIIKDALPEYSVAHSSGQSEVAYHGTGIVFSDQPYYVAIMTNSPGNSSDQLFVKDLLEEIDNVMIEYNSYNSEEFE